MALIAGSDIIIIAASVAMGKTARREDLLHANKIIAKTIGEAIRHYAHRLELSQFPILCILWRRCYSIMPNAPGR
ncbi:MAG: hypothetical protein DU429_07950 [Candidatus Tokpelaia sp.]|nr:MAG: hypothetical protein DU429_07950 [Candidatus Tokpelaia sp.]KAA6206087.1 MAG: hypothetical protein DU430_02315 [Candidatus Tokpelaia sp.]KAA6405634.1 hypothetical protein DPQ22_03740 [Candidatus Tokpelaia sp.]